MSNIKDLDLDIKTIKKTGNKKIILLNCVSSYPAPINEQNLKSIIEIKKKYKTLVGLSDHTLGLIAPVVAVSKGAKMIEKHFNIRNNKAVDSFFSTNANDFKIMVEGIRSAELSFGNGKIEISKSSKENLNSRRSIYISQDIKKGERFSSKNIKIIRPGFGLHPKYYKFVLNKKSKNGLKIGDRMMLRYVSKD